MDEESSLLRKMSGLFVFPDVPDVDKQLRSVSAESLSSMSKDDQIKHLREVIRVQGEFIMSLKHQIRDFLGNA